LAQAAQALGSPSAFFKTMQFLGKLRNSR